MKKILKGQRGFALITTLLVLMLVSMLGLAVMSVAASNFTMTGIDNISQSAYYIAEAGVNHM
ncbi:MAG: hypothetical protein GX329_07585, partial [Tissierellia bacterium]|nr:hypothetical protein [Tissierellia bacterium]